MLTLNPSMHQSLLAVQLPRLVNLLVGKLARLPVMQDFGNTQLKLFVWKSSDPE